MEDHQFWFKVWCVVAGFVVAIVWGFLGYSTSNNLIIERMVENGTSPIAAHCAIDGVSTYTAAMCALVTVGGKE